MDQNTSFPAHFDLDFFPPLHYPHSLTVPDSLDVSKLKDNISNLGSPSHKHNKAFEHRDSFHMDSFFFDMHHDGSFKNDGFFKNWQNSQPINFFDGGFDHHSFGMREKDFGFDPYQICRSRGGSFNFGRFRKDSEDIFHMNSDLFRHMRGTNDSKNPLDNLARKSFHFPHIHESHSPKILNDAPNLFEEPMHQPQILQGHMDHLQSLKKEFGGNNTQETTKIEPETLKRNISSIVDNNDDTEVQLNKKGRKKRLLNDKTEAATESESENKPAAKPGRPKKIKDDVSQSTPKLTKSKSSNPSQQLNNKFGPNESFLAKAEAYEDRMGVRDDRSTENSSNVSKIDSPHHSVGMQMRAPEGFMGGLNMNMMNEMKEMMKNSNLMAQPWLENKKIGTLTFAERRAKIERYLEKRKKRTWSRKINYDCRKRVADSRLRIKGRFVTRDQAFVLLDEAGVKFDPETITNADIKTILTEKFGSLLKKKTSDGQETLLDGETKLENTDFGNDDINSEALE